MKQLKVLLFLYVSFFLLFLYTQFFRLPIFAGDTDIWYHLNSGRYILENLKIPKDSYFSFISPPRDWTDYYWLFQVIVYSAYSVGEYYGLVILRGLLFILVTVLIFFLLFGDKKDDDKYPFLIIFFLFVVILLHSRYTLLRPHTFSYLFLVLFIYILEVKKAHIKYLPILGVLWTNIHGIEYPVMLFVVLSYLIDFMYERKRNGMPVEKKDIPYVIPFLVTALTPFFTPHFTQLMVMPFVPISFAKHYIQELATFSLLDFTSIRVDNFRLSYQTVILFLLFFASLSLIHGLITRVVRLRHILLFLLGLILLSKGKRFAYECFLLVIPLVRLSVPSISFESLKKEPSKLFVGALIIIMLISPFLHIKKSLGSISKYPFSFNNLPHGVTLFLKQIDAEGYVLNHPNPGGYLQWMLYPKYKIFMDMEVPFLFTNEDMFTATRIFNFFDEKILKDTLTTYKPSFIIASISNPGFKSLMERFPDYRMIFFDDFYVLYANKTHYPQLVEKFELRKVDPYNLRNVPLQTKESDSIRMEFERILQFHPECAIANEYLARFNLKTRDFKKALFHAEHLIKAHPESPRGYTLKAEILKEMKLYKRAIVYYKKALKISETPDVVFAFGKVYFEMGDYKRAYDLMVKAINVFSPHTDHRDVYYVVKSAILSNRMKEAVVLFEYGIRMLPSEDAEYTGKYMELLPYLSSYLQENMQPYGWPRQKAKGPQ